MTKTPPDRYVFYRDEENMSLLLSLPTPHRPRVSLQHPVLHMAQNKELPKYLWNKWLFWSPQYLKDFKINALITDAWELLARKYNMDQV